MKKNRLVCSPGIPTMHVLTNTFGDQLRVSRGGLGKAGRCLGLEGRLEWVDDNQATLAQKLKILGWFWELHLDVMNVPWRQEERDKFESSLWMASRIRGAVHLKERVVQLYRA